MTTPALTSKSADQIETEWMAIEARRPGGALPNVERLLTSDKALKARAVGGDQANLLEIIEVLHHSLRSYHTEMGVLLTERDAHRFALDDALPVLELVFERGQLLDRMTQPDMSGRHHLQGELDAVERQLRRTWRPLRLLPVLQTARTALKGAP